MKPHFRLTKVWLNIYPQSSRCHAIQAGGAYLTKQEADAVAKSYRMACVPINVPIPALYGRWKFERRPSCDLS